MKEGIQKVVRESVLFVKIQHVSNDENGDPLTYKI